MSDDDFDFDFGVPPSSVDIQLQQEVADLKVLVDTLQTNLRSAEAIIKKYEPDCSLFKVPSYKWCVGWTDS